MDAFQILVIILSITLAIFLVLAIILTYSFIKISQTVRSIVSKADSVMDDVESVADFFKKTSVPLGVTSLVANIVSKITGDNKKGKK